MPHPGFRAHDFGGEGLDVGGRYPGRTETRCDVRRTEIFGLHAPQRRDVALVARILCGRRLGDRQFGADGTRQIGIVGLPGFRGRVAEHRLAELGEGGLGIAVEQFGEMIDIHAPGLVEGDGERVGGGRDQSGADGGAITRSRKIGPMRARPLSRS